MFKETYDIKNGDLIKNNNIVCDCCHNKTDNYITEHYNDDNGFMSSGNLELHICKKCCDKVYYQTEYGFTFIKALDRYNDETILYLNMNNNLWGNYERIRSQQQIDEAFNPDKCRFNRWLNR